MNQPAKWNVTCSGDVKANSFYLTPKTKKKTGASTSRSVELAGSSKRKSSTT